MFHTVDEHPAARDRYLSARGVMNRYGVSEMALHRWLRDKNLRFPRPTYLKRRRYWSLTELIRWEEDQALLSKRKPQ